MTFHPKMPYDTGLHRSERQLPAPGDAFEFTPENRARLEEIAKRYPPDRRRSALLPALFLVQRQQGYVSARAIEHVAQAIGVTPAQVEDVVSYYTMFFSQPVGTYVLQVCRTLSCALNGAERPSSLGLPVPPSSRWLCWPSARWCSDGYSFPRTGTAGHCSPTS